MKKGEKNLSGITLSPDYEHVIDENVNSVKVLIKMFLKLILTFEIQGHLQWRAAPSRHQLPIRSQLSLGTSMRPSRAH